MWILLFKNIKSFIKTKPVLFAFILVSQIVCILATFTVAGMIDAATPKPEDERGDYQKAFEIRFADYSADTSEDYIFMNKVYNKKNGKLIYCGLDEEKVASIEAAAGDSSNETISIFSYNLPKNYKNLLPYKRVKDQINTVLQRFRRSIRDAHIHGFTDNTCTVDFSGVFGTKKIMEEKYPYLQGDASPIKLYAIEGFDTSFAKYNDGDKLKIINTEYIVTSVDKCSSDSLSFTDSCIMNSKDVDNDFLITSFLIFPNENATAADRYNMETYIKENFGDIALDIKNPEPEPLIEKQFNNMIYVVSFIMIAVVLLNISRLYSYILSKRKNTLAVFELCGAGKGQMFSLYFLEVFITLAVSFAIGFAIFRFTGIGLLNSVYPDLQEFFTAQIYLTIFGAYMLIGSLIMAINILPLVAKSAVDLKRR